MIFDSFVNVVRHAFGLDSREPPPVAPQSQPTIAQEKLVSRRIESLSPLSKPREAQSVRELASELQVEPSVIVRWCKKERIPSVETENGRLDRTAREEITRAWQQGRLYPNPFDANVLLIDSNIWMAHQYQLLFDRLEGMHGRYLEMRGIQYDEICNLKSSAESAKAHGARTALRRIESFQKADRLKIDGVASMARRGTHFDPVLLEIFNRAVISKLPVTLITDDRDVRIRADAMTSKTDSTEVHIFDGKEATAYMMELPP